MEKQVIPVEVIISSFRGTLTAEQSASLQEWISTEGNKEKYEALRRLWDTTVADASQVSFSPKSGFRVFRKRISNVWRKVAVAASIAAVLAISYTLYMSFMPQPVLEQVCTCVTGKSVVTLPDGSVAVLHKGARLTYDNKFDSSRSVSLKGEAYFEVVKDERNEFVVSVDDIDVVVRGTTFNVNENCESVIISLVEGAVDVITGEGTECRLAPGQSATYDKDSGNLIRQKDDVIFASCWAQDRLTFTQATLGEVCRYMSKWYRVDIVVPESLRESCSYTFTIKDEPIDQILDIMSRINPMKYLYTNDRRIIISEIQ